MVQLRRFGLLLLLMLLLLLFISCDLNTQEDIALRAD